MLFLQLSQIFDPILVCDNHSNSMNVRQELSEREGQLGKEYVGHALNLNDR